MANLSSTPGPLRLEDEEVPATPESPPRTPPPRAVSTPPPEQKEIQLFNLGDLEPPGLSFDGHRYPRISDLGELGDVREVNVTGNEPRRTRAREPAMVDVSVEAEPADIEGRDLDPERKQLWDGLYKPEEADLLLPQAEVSSMRHWSADIDGFMISSAPGFWLDMLKDDVSILTTAGCNLHNNKSKYYLCVGNAHTSSFPPTTLPRPRKRLDSFATLGLFRDQGARGITAGIVFTTLEKDQMTNDIKACHEWLVHESWCATMGLDEGTSIEVTKHRNYLGLSKLSLDLARFSKQYRKLCAGHGGKVTERYGASTAAAFRSIRTYFIGQHGNRNRFARGSFLSDSAGVDLGEVAEGIRNRAESWVDRLEQAFDLQRMQSISLSLGFESGIPKAVAYTNLDWAAGEPETRAGDHAEQSPEFPGPRAAVQTFQSLFDAKAGNIQMNGAPTYLSELRNPATHLDHFQQYQAIYHNFRGRSHNVGDHDHGVEATTTQPNASFTNPWSYPIYKVLRNAEDLKLRSRKERSAKAMASLTTTMLEATKQRLAKLLNLMRPEEHGGPNAPLRSELIATVERNANWFTIADDGHSALPVSEMVRNKHARLMKQEIVDLMSGFVIANLHQINTIATMALVFDASKVWKWKEEYANKMYNAIKTVVHTQITPVVARSWELVETNAKLAVRYFLLEILNLATFVGSSRDRQARIDPDVTSLRTRMTAQNRADFDIIAIKRHERCDAIRLLRPGREMSEDEANTVRLNVHKTLPQFHLTRLRPEYFQCNPEAPTFLCASDFAVAMDAARIRCVRPGADARAGNQASVTETLEKLIAAFHDAVRDRSQGLATRSENVRNRAVAVLKEVATVLYNNVTRRLKACKPKSMPLVMKLAVEIATETKVWSKGSMEAHLKAIRANIKKDCFAPARSFGELVLWCIKNRCCLDTGEAGKTASNDWQATKREFLAKMLKLKEGEQVPDGIDFGPDIVVAAPAPAHWKYISFEELVAEIDKSAFNSVDVFPNVMMQGSDAFKQLRLNWLDFSERAERCAILRRAAVLKSMHTAVVPVLVQLDVDPDPGIDIYASNGQDSDHEEEKAELAEIMLPTSARLDTFRALPFVTACTTQVAAWMDHKTIKNILPSWILQLAEGGIDIARPVIAFLAQHVLGPSTALIRALFESGSPYPPEITVDGQTVPMDVTHHVHLGAFLLLRVWTYWCFARASEVAAAGGLSRPKVTELGKLKVSSTKALKLWARNQITHKGCPSKVQDQFKFLAKQEPAAEFVATWATAEDIRRATERFLAQP